VLAHHECDEQTETDQTWATAGFSLHVTLARGSEC